MQDGNSCSEEMKGTHLGGQTLHSVGKRRLIWELAVRPCDEQEVCRLGGRCCWHETVPPEAMALVKAPWHRRLSPVLITELQRLPESGQEMRSGRGVHGAAEGGSGQMVQSLGSRIKGLLLTLERWRNMGRFFEQECDDQICVLKRRREMMLVGTKVTSSHGESGRNPRSEEEGLAACGDWLGAEAEGEAVVKDEARLLALAPSGSWAIP